MFLTSINYKLVILKYLVFVDTMSITGRSFPSVLQPGIPNNFYINSKTFPSQILFAKNCLESVSEEHTYKCNIHILITQTSQNNNAILQHFYFKIGLIYAMFDDLICCIGIQYFLCLIFFLDF